jgi:chemotaxis protein MotB
VGFRRIFNHRIFIVLLTVLVSACVTPHKHQLVVDELSDARDKLAAAEARIAELEGKLGMASTEQSKLTDSYEETKKALADAEKRKQEAEKRLADYRELTAKFKKLVDAGKLQIKFVNGKMVLALSTDILFPSGSAALSAQGALAIKEVTQVLSGLKGKKFQIEGHTDNDPIVSKKTFVSNWDLASARAMTVLNTMLESGMPSETISAASYGDTQPVMSNKTAKGKAANRRIAIVVVPDLTGLPGFDQLNRMTASE